jgi:two-component system, sensor histidine kinase and response regulator
MSWREHALGKRLRLVVWTLASVSVLSAGLLYLGADGVSVWRRASARLVAETNLTAQAAALAMDENNNSVVRSALDTLRTDPSVSSAVLRDRTGQVIAAWPDTAGANGGKMMKARGFTAQALDVPVQPSLARRGTLHVEADFKDELLTAVWACLAFTLAFGVITAVLVALLLWYLTKSVRAPVEGLLRSVRELRASGEMQRRLEGGGRDEFGALHEEINGLLEGREASESSLRAYKSEFERRVIERTQQLDAVVAEAREAVSRAERANRSKSDFLARMSHEIRTPLNGVLGMAELLQDSPKLDDRQRRYAIVIHQSGRALLQLINDILDFSKIEAGKLQLETERFDVREMVEDALEIMGERAQSKGLELICDVPSDFETVVFGDCLRLRQVIINLVGNSVKFTERGDITVSVGMQPGVPAASYTFEVIDTGIGIKPEDCTNIFEAFVQADPSASRRYGGTGLGLSICQQLVHLMGGTIGVDSTLGKGSNFHFTVPLTLDRTAPRDKTGRTLSGTRVLIVEKSVAVRRMLRQHLQSWGAICSDVASLETALPRLRQAFSGEFDVLILDSQWSGTTTSALATAVRNIPAFAETPILMLYAGSGEPPAEARNLRGPLAWANKPVRRSQLGKTLERLLGKADGSEQQPPSKGSEPARHVPAEAPAGTRGRRILVVEDNPVNQEVVAAMLQKLDCDVQLASSGKEALEVLARSRYDLVFMDCQMPDLDGYETTRRLREWELLEGRARVPVIALTANALSGDAEKCLAAGMDRYLTKPMSIEQLRKALESPLAPESPPAGQSPSAWQSPVAAAPASPTTAPVDPRASGRQEPREAIDGHALERIRTLNVPGKPDLLERLAAVYASSSATLVDVLRRAALTGDATALRQAAHGLKSSSHNVGAIELAKLCQEVELAASDHRLEMAEELVDRLILEHENVLQSLGRKAAAPAAANTPSTSRR